MASLRQLTIKITGESSGFERAIAQAQKSAQGLAEKLTSVGSVLTQSVTLPIGLIGGAALKAAAEMEALTNGLRAVTKEAGPLQSQLDRLKRVAELPGLGFKEAVQGSINLQAAGFSAKTAERALSAFGNALATVGKGRADLNGVVLALTQIQAKGKVSAEEINQLQERLPQVRKALVDAFGTAEGTELAKKGLGTTEVINRLIAEFEKLPQVTGGLGNSFENLKDKAEQSLAKIGQAISPFAIKAIDALEPIIGVVGRIGEGFAALPGPVQTGVVAIAGIAAAAGPIALIISKLAELRVVILSLGATSIGSAVLGPLLELGRAIPVVLSGSGTLALSFGAVATAAVGAGIATAFFLSKLSDPNRGLDEKAKGLANLQNKLNDLKPISKSTLASFEQFGEITSRVFGDIQRKAEALNLDKAFAGLGIKSTVELQKALKDAQDFAEQIRKGVEAGTASQLDYARALEVVHARQNELNGTVDQGNRFFRAIPFDEKTKEGALFNLIQGALIGNTKKLRDEIQALVLLPKPDFSWAANAPFGIQDLNTGIRELAETMQRIDQTTTDSAIAYLKAGDALQQLQEQAKFTKSALDLLDGNGRFIADAAKDASKRDLALEFPKFQKPSADTQEFTRQLKALKDGAIRDVASGFVDAISSAKSFGEAMRDVASSVSRNILHFVIERGIKLLIGQLGNLLDSLGSVGSAFSKIFGTASSVATTAGNAAGGISGAASSAATGIAGGAITGIVGAVSGVVTAVSSVIGLFQTARIEKDVGRIEVTTRGILNESLNLRAAAQLQYDGTFLRLGDIWNTLKEIRDTRGNAGFGSGQSITVGTMVVNAGATSSPREAAQAIIREFKLMGARA